MAPAEFEARFERPAQPVMLAGLAASWAGESRQERGSIAGRGSGSAAAHALRQRRPCCIWRRDPAGLPGQLWSPAAPLRIPRLPARRPLCAGGSLEAWQPARLAKVYGDRLVKVSKPFLTGGALGGGFRIACLPVWLA